MLQLPRQSLGHIFLLALMVSFPVTAQGDTSMDEITVFGSPLSDAEGEGLPYQVETFDSDDLQANQYTSIADLLDRHASGVVINHAQNNPLQPDVQVRGFTASPLLGAPQGVAVYLNGVRVNEPFGDTVNWDLLETSFLDRLSLVSGANAAYGLNALGGSLLLTSKTGFSSAESRLTGSTGSFHRHQLSASRGDNDGRWGYFAGVHGFKEDGWRDYSESRAYNGYGSVSFRGEDLEWDLFLLASDTDLRGNGAAPEQLLTRDREAVFTHPDITENRLSMASTQFRVPLDDDASYRGNLFFRSNETDSFNGDGSEFEECGGSLGGFLCEEDEGDVVVDQIGQPIEDSYDAINNISEREQRSWGATAEYYRRWRLANVPHHSSLGLDFYRGTTTFQSAVELASLRPNRATTRSGRFDAAGATRLDTRVQSAAIYWIDRFNAGERNEVTLSLRYNTSEVETEDKSGLNPALDGDHRFNRLNGGVGLRHTFSDSTDVFAHIHQSSRTPTPVELACSHPDAPCTLPNTFLADPPLDQVVARNLEIGLRQSVSSQTNWRINGFISRIEDDIVFQTTGGVSSNEGFFSNASDTRRAGLSARVSTGTERLRWTFRYDWLRATFEDDFLVSSPQHPMAVNGYIPVSSGDTVPGLPEHSATLTGDWQLHGQVSWRWDAQYKTGVYLRGDEGNLDQRTDDLLVVNTTLNFRPAKSLELFVAIHNLFDREGETFGLYGEPDEVIPQLRSGNNRFLSPNEPRGAWLGAKYTW